MAILFIVLGASLSTSFLCSVLEAVLLSTTHGYVAVLQEKGDPAGDVMHRLQEKIDEPIAAILTLNTIANTLGSALSGGLAYNLFGDKWIAFFSAGLTMAVLIFSEIIPKTIGATFWTQLAKPAAYVLRIMIIVMKPILIPLSVFQRMITSDKKPPKVSRAELEVLAELGRREGAIDESEWRVVSNIMRLDEVTVGEVMTPRTDIVAVEVGATVEEAKAIMAEEGRLRLPVYGENLDQIEGILLARDLWKADLAGAKDIRSLIRPAHFAPATKAVEDLIPEMRNRRMKMAIVVDEFGGTAGLVTLEDLIEEIIGEIQDEYEHDEPQLYHDLGESLLRIWGGIPLREVNERLDLELPEETYDTLGGFVFGELNRVGQVGDVVKVDGGSFRVVKMRGRRIEYVVFTPSEDGR